MNDRELFPQQDTVPFLTSLTNIIHNKPGDNRPYLEVDIFNRKFLGLLDSGASHTFIPIDLFKGLGLKLLKSEIKYCKVGNGSSLSCLGECQLPITLEGNTKLVNIVVVDNSLNMLVLGVNFWKTMGVVPNLNNNNWSFNQTNGDGCNLYNFHMEDGLQLSLEERVQMGNAIDRYFKSQTRVIGCTDWVVHEISTDAPPIKQKYYRVSPYVQKQIDEELTDMLKNDIIEKSVSPWSSPILLIKKKDGKHRFVVDFRKLNKVTRACAYPLPHMNAILDKLKDAKYLSAIDVKSAYWQIPLSETSKEYTAFTVPGRGLYQFKRMPFGLHSGGATWQRLIDLIIGPELEPYAFAYLDDIIIVTETFEEHLRILNLIFDRLQQAGIIISREKSRFCAPELKYLGYIVTPNGLAVDPDKISAVLNISQPKNIKETRSLLGMISWYRRFVKNYSSVISPLNDLTKKNVKFVWTTECDRAFARIKECLATPPILAYPDFDKCFEVQCDASGFGVGAVLSQKYDGGDRVISYLSRSLTRQERNYSVTERECLAVLWAIEKLRPYIEGAKFRVITDHSSLVWLNNLKNPTGRLARWAVRLQQYDYEIIHRKGQDNVVPDTLSRAVPLLNAIVKINDKWYNNMLDRVALRPDKYPLYQIKEGELFYHAKPKLLDNVNEWKVVIPKDGRTAVLFESHDSELSGHCGIYKTLDKLQRKYYWPGMKTDVARYIGKCAICQSVKVENRKPAGKMLNTSVVIRPWQQISIDFVGPLPRSKSGNCWLFVVLDCFSKFVKLFPLKKALASKVVQIIEDEIFLCYGVPERIICDNARNLSGNLMKSLCREYNVILKTTPFYHPQSNPVERVNRVVKSMITSYLTGDQRDWDKKISKIGCAIRNNVHESTGFTPYFVNYGCHQSLKGSDKYTNETPQSVENNSQSLQTIYEAVRRRMKASFEKNQKRYDLRKRPDQFEVGNMVMRKNYSLSGKIDHYCVGLAPKFLGPFKVIKKLSPWMYELAELGGKYAGRWHIKDLKKFQNETEDTDSDSSGF